MQYQATKHSIRSGEDLAKLKTEWEALETGGDMTAFQSYFWNTLLVEQRRSGPLRRLQTAVEVIVVRREARPVLIVPLLVVKAALRLKEIGWRRGVYFLGANSVSDYLNAVYSDFDGEAFEEALRTLRAEHPGLEIRLDLIREDTALHRWLKGRGCAGTECAVYADLPVPETAELYEKQLSKNTRQNLRTAVNRAERDGISYRTELLLGKQPRSLAEELNALHAQRVAAIRSKELPKNFLKRAYRRLYHWNLRRQESQYPIVMESMMRNERSVLFLVRLREQLAGYLYGVVDAGSVRIIHNCFDAEFSWYSPLTRGCRDFILLECEQRRLGVPSIDFTRGDEDYKLKLGCSTHNLYSYVL